MESEKILDVQNLSVDYLTERGNVRACDDISFTLNRGEILGIAGESASGKSTLLNALSRLQRPPAVTVPGSVIKYYKQGDAEGTDLSKFDDNSLLTYRWDAISIVMQSAMACLNPVTKLRAQFTDVLFAHKKVTSKAQANKIAEETLSMVGIPSHRLDSFPFELSGGMQQRAIIALALVCEPDLVMMDEPTTAVDVVMQRQILEEILNLQKKLGFSICFVTHDLSLLLEIADQIIIMYGGKVVEQGSAKQIFDAGLHPYTRGLRGAYPSISEKTVRRTGIPGDPPDLLGLPKGCAFEPRCSLKVAGLCEEKRPGLVKIADNSFCRCFVTEKEKLGSMTLEKGEREK